MTTSDPTNEERAKRIPPVLDKYAAVFDQNPPDENTIRDLLTDLMHYCLQEHINFALEFRSAQEHFMEEIYDGN